MYKIAMQLQFLKNTAPCIYIYHVCILEPSINRWRAWGRGGGHTVRELEQLCVQTIVKVSEAAVARPSTVTAAPPAQCLVGHTCSSVQICDDALSTYGQNMKWHSPTHVQHGPWDSHLASAVLQAMHQNPRRQHYCSGWVCLNRHWDLRCHGHIVCLAYMFSTCVCGYRWQ